MDLNLINILLVVGVLVGLIMALRGIDKLFRRKWSPASRKFWVAYEEGQRLRDAVRQEQGGEPKWDDVDPDVIAKIRASDAIMDEQGERKRRTLRLFQRLNLVTTVIGLIPLGFAIYNFVTNNQRQALNFNLAALATVVVTKGGVFLLTAVLTPVAKALPTTIAGAIISKKVGEMMDARKQKEKPPTSD